MRATTLTLAAAACAAALAPATAIAGVVSVDAGTVRFAESRPGEANDVSLSIGTDGGLAFSDSDAPLQAGPGCASDEATGFTRCPLGDAITIDTGGGDDHVALLTLSGGPLPDGVRVALGDGNDGFRGDEGAEVVDGGAGDDELAGWGGDDRLSGGPGVDDLDGERGRDALDGGEGDDTFTGDRHDAPFADRIDGGPGIDLLDDYVADGDPALAPVTRITLDGRADDGKPGEGDDLAGIERFATQTPIHFTGSDGPDDVVAPEVGGVSRLDGRGGDDRLVAGDASGDVVLGGAGDDELAGGMGDDRVVGGPGRDRLSGDRPARCNELHCDMTGSYGNDAIEARDGARDSIDCGGGQDRVIADRKDVVADDCEQVKRR